MARSCNISSLCAWLALAAGHACAQCSNPALFEIGGMPGAVCPGTSGGQAVVEAVARGRFVSFEQVPLAAGSPVILSRFALDHPARFMHSSIVGRVWATDGATLYGILATTPTSPTLMGRITIPGVSTIDRLRNRGNFVYALDGSRMYIVDITTPATPVLRSTFNPGNGTSMNDLEVVGSYAYVSISESPTQVNSLMIVDISNPLSPFEVRRLGNSGRAGFRISKAPNINSLYTLSRNASHGSLEMWSLSNASNPPLTSVNATLNQDLYDDELRATNNAIVRLSQRTRQLWLYSTTSTLATLGTPVNMEYYPVENVSLGADIPYIFVTRENGELFRANFTSTGGVTSFVNQYIDVPPGYTKDVLTLGEGHTILTNSTGDMWVYFFASATSPPQYAGHIKSDAGFSRFANSATLATGGYLFVSEYGGTSPNNFTRIKSYALTGLAVFPQGSVDVPGYVYAMDTGFDNAGARRLYCTSYDFSSSPYTLRVINAANPASLSQIGTFAVTEGVGDVIRFLPGSAATGTPPRVLVGGDFAGLDRTQIVSVESAGTPASLGVIPSASRAIIPGTGSDVWLLSRDSLRCFNIATPAAPVLRSQTYVDSPNAYARDMAFVGTNILGIAGYGGQFTKVDVSNAAAPSLLQVVQVGSNLSSFGWLNGVAFNGANIHFAAGADGYVIYPTTFSAPPHEDYNHALRLLGNRGVVPLCTGVPLSITATFVASPAVTSLQWLKYNPATSQFVSIVNGPTGTGSTISGATMATLTINNPGVSDRGFYSCRATNTCGTVDTESVVEVRPGGYANCDSSTIAPILNVQDFACFLNRFAANDSRANCDGSTAVPELNILDFNCFLNQFASACP